jgi:nicotinamidase-related amidase
MSEQASVLDQKRTALLVMDFQQDVLRRMPGLEPLVAWVQGAIAGMRDHGGTIGYVRVYRGGLGGRPAGQFGLRPGRAEPHDAPRGPVHGHPRCAGSAAGRAQIIDTATLRGLLSP